jgi:hypothetical protein
VSHVSAIHLRCLQLGVMRVRSCGCAFSLTPSNATVRDYASHHKEMIEVVSPCRWRFEYPKASLCVSLYNLLWARFALFKMIEIARRPLQVCLNQLMTFGGRFVRVLRGYLMAIVELTSFTLTKQGRRLRKKRMTCGESSSGKERDGHEMQPEKSVGRER